MAIDLSPLAATHLVPLLSLRQLSHMRTSILVNVSVAYNFARLDLLEWCAKSLVGMSA